MRYSIEVTHHGVGDFFVLLVFKDVNCQVLDGEFAERQQRTSIKTTSIGKSIDLEIDIDSRINLQGKADSAVFVAECESVVLQALFSGLRTNCCRACQCVSARRKLS